MKKFLSALIVFSLLVSPFTVFSEEGELFDVEETSESGEISDESEEPVQEKSLYEKCIFDKDKSACEVIQKDKRDSISNIEAQIKEAQTDREKARALAVEYSQKAESMQGEIDELYIKINELKIKIDELEKKIEELEKSIEENQKKVDELNARVKSRMVEAQKTMHFSGYLEFILGSVSFSDMLSRVYGVKAIMSKDKADRVKLLSTIEKLNKDKEELKASKEELESKKQELDDSYYEIVAKQNELIAMQEFYEEEEARINEELDAMTAERDNIYESFEDLKRAIKDANMVVNTGFVAGVHNSWISSTVWNYDPDFLSGRWHLGVDYAAARGREIHAPAGGVVIRADDSCSDPGYLGSYCGAWISGGGNQVYLMAEVDGKVYGFIFFHLNTVYVSKGDYVSQDDVIGLVGSSGSSTGPHCHIEMYYLGTGDLFDYLDMSWNATFSVGRGATAYNNRCYNDDGSFRQGPPCILNPEWYLPN